ncbi:MAG: glycosyltransferase family 39 protein [Anaerolineae bacterium]|nr:glycosyltransferase family 39 protein [Anaerolineae bacterium]
MISRVRKHINQHWAIVVILIIYVILATLYNFANPLFEAPDEIHHYNFIRYIQQNRRLPVIDMDGPETQYHQTPLYYILTALVTAPLPHEESITPYTMRNPFWAYEIRQVGRDNKNQYLHNSSQRFPSPDAVVWAMHLTRALSTLFGCGTLLLTYLLARHFVSQPMAVAATAVTAFIPNFLFTSGAMTNDSLMILLCTAIILYIVRTVALEKAPPEDRWIGLGILLGMAFLTKGSAWPILGVAALMVTLLALRLKSWQIFFTAGTILFVVVGLVTGWWLARNVYHYGDLLGLKGYWATWGMRMPPTPDTYWAELVSFRRTFWANFGYGNIPLPEWAYIPIDLFVYIGVGGLVLAAIRTRRVPPTIIQRERLVILAGWVILAGIMLILFWYRATATNGRHIYAILPIIILAIIGGWHNLVAQKWHGRLAAVFGASTALLAVLSWAFILLPAYRPAPRITPAQAAKVISNRLDWRIDDFVVLQGYQISQSSVGLGDEVEITLYWQVLRSPEKNYSAYVYLVGMEGVQAGGRNTYPGLGNDPTIFWEPGEIIVDAIPVPVNEDAGAPVLLNVVVGLYDQAKDRPLDTYDRDNNPIEYPVIGTLKLQQPNAVPLIPQHLLDAEFAGGLILDGYDLSSTTVEPGSKIDLTLYWSPTGPLDVDYTTFVQLVDEQGNIVAQGDAPPRDGRYPTTSWGVGEHFDDAYQVDIADDVSAGTYHLLVGLYSLQNMSRLPLGDGADHIRLEQSIIVR